jgi:flagellar biosynthesis anti-sigma factor FlgM
MLDAYGKGGIDRTSETKSDAANPAGKQAMPGSTQAATLSISSEAKRLAAAHPPIDADKVEAVRIRIQSGDYKIDSTAIAERMLDRLA